jgi:hypothetical protein
MEASSLVADSIFQCAVALGIITYYISYEIVVGAIHKFFFSIREILLDLI